MTMVPEAQIATTKLIEGQSCSLRRDIFLTLSHQMREFLLNICIQLSRRNIILCLKQIQGKKMLQSRLQLLLTKLSSTGLRTKQLTARSRPSSTKRPRKWPRGTPKPTTEGSFTLTSTRAMESWPKKLPRSTKKSKSKRKLKRQSNKRSKPNMRKRPQKCRRKPTKSLKREIRRLKLKRKQSYKVSKELLRMLERKMLRYKLNLPPK